MTNTDQKARDAVAAEIRAYANGRADPGLYNEAEELATRLLATAVVARAAIAAIPPPIPDRFDARECLAAEYRQGHASASAAMIETADLADLDIYEQAALRAITTAHRAGIAEGLRLQASAEANRTDIESKPWGGDHD